MTVLREYALRHLFTHLCGSLYYRTIRVIHPQRLDVAGAVLFVALHRNGAVDGLIYSQVVHHPTFMIAAQLRRSRLGRLFFTGIEVVRDGDRHDGLDPHAVNRQAMKACVDLLASGGRLCIFPEGTSDLGPRHLPFHAGAALILAKSLAMNIPVTLIPLGIHYDCAWCFGSRVEVVVGQPVKVNSLAPDAPPSALVRLCVASIEEGLLQVGVNFSDAARQQEVEQSAFLAASLGMGGYFERLKAWEHGLPSPVERALQSLFQRVAETPHLRYREIPLFPPTSLIRTGGSFMLTAPLALLAMLANVGPLMLARWAGKRFPDGPNVIALWRILIGVPALFLWGAGWSGAAIALKNPLLLPGYLIVTVLGLHAMPRASKHGVALFNGLFARGGLPAFRSLREELRACAPPHPSDMGP